MRGQAMLAREAIIVHSGSSSVPATRGNGKT
jgi:hypothetical protein